jgi:hypothetical protein
MRIQSTGVRLRWSLQRLERRSLCDPRRHSI